jgi:Ni/Co efflux regulator RcnB
MATLRGGKNQMKRILLLVAALAVAALAVTAVASADQGRHHRGDRNRDGLPDKWERAHHLSLKVNQAPRDQDRDGLNNKREFEHGTDPNKADTDDNGVDDENEVNPVGTIASFTNGTLTITLANGQTVSGQVTPQTEIKCENENGDFRGDGGGDNSGPGSSGSGDDDGANHDAGDDHGGRHGGGSDDPAGHH